MKVDNNILDDEVEVAGVFNNYFLTIVNDLPINDVKPSNFYDLHYRGIFNVHNEVSSMFIQYVSEGEVVKCMQSLKNGKAAGLDGISSYLVKSIAPTIASIFTYIVNFSLISGVFPSKLKEAVVIPIFKKGSRFDCNNYRPISLLSTFSKIIEKIMKQKLLSFLNKTKFFSSQQFGFQSGISTEIALLNFMNHVSRNINAGKKIADFLLISRRPLILWTIRFC